MGRVSSLIVIVVLVVVVDEGTRTALTVPDRTPIPCAKGLSAKEDSSRELQQSLPRIPKWKCLSSQEVDVDRMTAKTKNT